MKDIFALKRNNGNANAMQGIKQFLDTNKITDKELRSIAKYLSEQ